MSLVTLLIILLIVALIGSLPTWGWRDGSGYGATGGIGLVVLILAILVILGKI